MFRRQKADIFQGSDDVFFDAKEYHVANKNVANILSTQGPAKTEKDQQVLSVEKVEEATLDNMDAAWEEEGIDIDMPDDLMAEDNKGTGDPLIDGDTSNMDTDIFVPPNPGPDALKQALKKNP